jgi:Fe2+ transport system protein B
MIIEILFVVCMFLWFLANMPVPQIAAYNWANSWLAFIAVLLIGLYLFLPALRG